MRAFTWHENYKPIAIFKRDLRACMRTMHAWLLADLGLFPLNAHSPHAPTPRYWSMWENYSRHGWTLDNRESRGFVAWGL